MSKAARATKLPKRDMRHIFACLAATGHGWIVYRRDARGWDEAEINIVSDPLLGRLRRHRR